MGKQRSSGRASTVLGEVQLEIRNIYPSKKEWQAERKADGVFVGLQLEIGIKGQVGAELFDVVAAEPQGLKNHGVVDENGAIADRNIIVFQEFSWQSLERVLGAILQRCQSPSWEESVLKLQRYFLWEYEDFVGNK